MAGPRPSAEHAESDLSGALRPPSTTRTLHREAVGVARRSGAARRARRGRGQGRLFAPFLQQRRGCHPYGPAALARQSSSPGRSYRYPQFFEIDDNPPGLWQLNDPICRAPVGFFRFLAHAEEYTGAATSDDYRDAGRRGGSAAGRGLLVEVRARRGQGAAGGHGASPTEEPTAEPGKTHSLHRTADGGRRQAGARREDREHRRRQAPRGLKSADIVYIEQVEAGLTRLMAVFSSRLPPKVGPVRSARISDLHIVPQFGKPAFAYSGVQYRLLPFMAKASLYDVSDTRTGRLSSASRAASPPTTCSPPPEAAVAGTGRRQGQGHRLHLRRRPPAAGRTSAPTRQVARRALHLRLVRDGQEVADLAGRQEGHRPTAGGSGATIVVPVHQDRALSSSTTRTQSYTPLVHSVGKGSAVVLRDGKAYKATW